MQIFIVFQATGTSAESGQVLWISKGQLAGIILGIFFGLLVILLIIGAILALLLLVSRLHNYKHVAHSFPFTMKALDVRILWSSFQYAARLKQLFAGKVPLINVSLVQHV